MDFDAPQIDRAVFTLDDVVEVLRLIFKEHCDTEEVIEEEHLKMLAETMLNFFGYTTRVLDNMLQPEEREVFYTLEDMGLLRTEREETSLYDGREWRINYWVLNTELIMGYLNGYIVREKPREMDPSEIYFTLPEDLWDRMSMEKVTQREREGLEPGGEMGGMPPQFHRLLKNLKS